MMISEKAKLLITDLDGTLLTTDKRVTEFTKDYLVEFVNAGNILALCSGRDINSTTEVFESFGDGIKGAYICAYNGGQIMEYDSRKTVFKAGLDLETVSAIYGLADKRGIHVQAYSDDFVISKYADECVAFYRRHISTPSLITDKPMKYLPEKPCKMLCIELNDHEKQLSFRDELNAIYSDRLDIFFSNPVYLEIIPKGSGKGNSVRKLSEITGIPIENIIAAGDEENDISMIEAAGTGIAMINAKDSVKARADLITEFDNDHDGLARTLNKLFEKK